MSKIKTRHTFKPEGKGVTLKSGTTSRGVRMHPDKHADVLEIWNQLSRNAEVSAVIRALLRNAFLSDDSVAARLITAELNGFEAGESKPQAQVDVKEVAKEVAKILLPEMRKMLDAALANVAISGSVVPENTGESEETENLNDLFGGLLT